MSVIKTTQNFTRGEDPYKKLGVGGYNHKFARNLSVGSKLKAKNDGKIIKLNSVDYVSSTSIKKGDIFVITEVYDDFYYGNLVNTKRYIKKGDFFCINKDFINIPNKISVITMGLTHWLVEYVHEAENFTRGGNPFKKLQIGSYKKNLPYLDKFKGDDGVVVWDAYFPQEFTGLDMEYEGTIVFDTINTGREKNYRYLSHIEFSPEDESELDDAGVLGKIENYINNNWEDMKQEYYDHIDESLNFMRGGDPYNKLNIGTRQIIENLPVGTKLKCVKEGIINLIYGSNQTTGRAGVGNIFYITKKENEKWYFGKLEVDGQYNMRDIDETLTYAVYNKYINTSKDSDYFAKWEIETTNENLNENTSNNNVITDKQGRPLVVYHGTPDSRFEEIHNPLLGQKTGSLTTGSNEAVWFSDNYRTAKSYADPYRAWDLQKAKPKVLSHYIIMNNSLIVNAFGKEWRKAEFDFGGETIVGTRNLTKYAIGNGYDGLIVKNVYDHYNHFKGENKVKANLATNYAVFSDAQIIDIKED